MTVAATRTIGDDTRSALRTLLGTMRLERTGQIPAVHRWTGVEVRALRNAKRHSVREFARYLGVSDRMVSKWEAGGAGIRPRPVNQAALDTALARLDASGLVRFAEALHAAATHLGNGQRRWADLVGERRFEVHLTLTATTLAWAQDVAAELAAALCGHPDFDLTLVTVSATDRPGARIAVPQMWDGSG